jgi:hypothetical protein
VFSVSEGSQRLTASAMVQPVKPFMLLASVTWQDSEKYNLFL